MTTTSDAGGDKRRHSYATLQQAQAIQAAMEAAGFAAAVSPKWFIVRQNLWPDIFAQANAAVSQLYQCGGLRIARVDFLITAGCQCARFIGVQNVPAGDLARAALLTRAFRENGVSAPRPTLQQMIFGQGVQVLAQVVLTASGQLPIVRAIVSDERDGLTALVQLLREQHVDAALAQSLRWDLCQKRLFDGNGTVPIDWLLLPCGYQSEADLVKLPYGDEIWRARQARAVQLFPFASPSMSYVPPDGISVLPPQRVRAYVPNGSGMRFTSQVYNPVLQLFYLVSRVSVRFADAVVRLTRNAQGSAEDSSSKLYAPVVVLENRDESVPEPSAS